MISSVKYRGKRVKIAEKFVEGMINAGLVMGALSLWSGGHGFWAWVVFALAL